jgi:hypothetical protein
MELRQTCPDGSPFTMLEGEQQNTRLLQSTLSSLLFQIIRDNFALFVFWFFPQVIGGFLVTILNSS